MANNTALEILNLKKSRKSLLVMDEISFNVHAGEIFVLAGVKGSGKSLLSKIVMSLVKKTDGSVKVGGVDNIKKFETAIKQIGAVTEEQSFYMDMSGFKAVSHSAALNMRPISRGRIINIMTLLGLRRVMHLPIARYNRSQLQLLKIASAIASKPELLVLDEPLKNLGLEQKRAVSLVIKTLAAKNEVAVFFTTESLSEVQDICDTIAIIDDGMIVQIKSYNSMLRDDAPFTKISISTPTPNLAAKLIMEKSPYTASLCGSYVIVGTQPQNAQKVVDMLRVNGVKVFGAERVNRPLDALFFETLQRKRVKYHS